MRDQIQKILLVQDAGLLDKLEGVAAVQTFQTGDEILRIGEYQKKLYFLIDGIVRCYLKDGSGREHTDSFLAEFGCPVMTASLSLPSLSGHVAVTPVQLLAFPVDEWMTLLGEYTELLWKYNAILQKTLFFNQEIKSFLARHNTIQRYVWFVRKWPEVEACAASKHVASFLAITPETLSRVRHQVRSSEDALDLLSASNSE